MFFILLVSISIAFVVYSCLNTYWIEEYLELFQVHKWSNLFYYRDYKSSDQVDFIQYITWYHNNFFTRLLLCPICLSFWLSLFLSIIFDKAFHCLVISFLSILLYFILVRLSNKE